MIMNPDSPHFFQAGQEIQIFQSLIQITGILIISPGSWSDRAQFQCPPNLLQSRIQDHGRSPRSIIVISGLKHHILPDRRQIRKSLFIIIVDTYDWDDAEPIEEHKVKKYYVDDVEVEVIDVNVQYLDENGKLIAENIKSFCRNFMLKRFPEKQDFIDTWQSASNKTKLIASLSEAGLFIDELRREYGKEFDVYDILLQNTYGIEPLTREQRAQKADRILEQLNGDCKNIFADVLVKYVEVGIPAIENRNIFRIEPFTSQYGTGVEIVRKIGGNEKYIEITDKLKKAIYEG